MEYLCNLGERSPVVKALLNVGKIKCLRVAAFFKKSLDLRRFDNVYCHGHSDFGIGHTYGQRHVLWRRHDAGQWNACQRSGNLRDFRPWRRIALHHGHYEGDSTFGGSTSPPVSQTLNKAATSTTLSGPLACWGRSNFHTTLE